MVHLQPNFSIFIERHKVFFSAIPCSRDIFFSVSGHFTSMIESSSTTSPSGLAPRKYSSSRHTNNPHSVTVNPVSSWKSWIAIISCSCPYLVAVLPINLLYKRFLTVASGLVVAFSLHIRPKLDAVILKVLSWCHKGLELWPLVFCSMWTISSADFF